MIPLSADNITDLNEKEGKSMKKLSILLACVMAFCMMSLTACSSEGNVSDDPDKNGVISDDSGDGAIEKGVDDLDDGVNDVIGNDSSYTDSTNAAGNSSSYTDSTNVAGNSSTFNNSQASGSMGTKS